MRCNGAIFMKMMNDYLECTQYFNGYNYNRDPDIECHNYSWRDKILSASA